MHTDVREERVNEHRFHNLSLTHSAVHVGKSQCGSIIVVKFIV